MSECLAILHLAFHVRYLIIENNYLLKPELQIRIIVRLMRDHSRGEVHPRIVNARCLLLVSLAATT